MDYPPDVLALPVTPGCAKLYILIIAATVGKVNSIGAVEKLLLFVNIGYAIARCFCLKNAGQVAAIFCSARVFSPFAGKIRARTEPSAPFAAIVGGKRAALRGGLRIFAVQRTARQNTAYNERYG